MELDCHAIRLAESSLAAVDACECGTLRLHIGALTLRFPEHALRELNKTLTDALAAHSSAFSNEDACGRAMTFRRERGDA